MLIGTVARVSQNGPEPVPSVQLWRLAAQTEIVPRTIPLWWTNVLLALGCTQLVEQGQLMVCQASFGPRPCVGRAPPIDGVQLWWIADNWTFEDLFGYCYYFKWFVTLSFQVSYWTGLDRTKRKPSFRQSRGCDFWIRGAEKGTHGKRDQSKRRRGCWILSV